MTFRPSTYPRLAMAGYEFDTDRVKAPGADHHMTKENTVTKLEGRLNNIAYMAYAIDMFEGVDTAETQDIQGTKQFLHLMNRDRDLVWTGYMYVGLRRLQRQGNNKALRAGLALLTAAEDGVIAMSDAVEAIAPDLADAYRHSDGSRIATMKQQLLESA